MSLLWSFWTFTRWCKRFAPTGAGFPIYHLGQTGRLDWELRRPGVRGSKVSAVFPSRPQWRREIEEAHIAYEARLGHGWPSIFFAFEFLKFPALAISSVTSVNP